MSIAKPLFHTITATIALLSFSVSGQAIQSKISFGLAVQRYRSGQYKIAEGSFRQLVEQFPENQQYRYMYANTLVQLCQNNEALVQYKVCMQLDPTSVLGKSALSAIDRRTAKRVQSDTSSAPILVSKLSKQLDELKSKNNLHTLAKRSFEEGAQKASLAQKQALEKTNVLIENEQSYAFRVHPRYGAYVQEEQSKIDAEAGEASARSIREAKDRSARYEAAAAKSDTMLETSAKNLASQTAPGKSKNSIQLDPIHSNMYVRSFLPKQSVRLSSE